MHETHAFKAAFAAVKRQSIALCAARERRGTATAAALLRCKHQWPKMAEMASIYDVAVIGGGVVGCGVARACALAGRKTVLIEREAALAASHASGGNTGIACTAADCEPGTVEHVV